MTLWGQNAWQKIKFTQAFSYSLFWWHWPTGGTAQIQRAGAVGGRLNWSSTVLDRAGSITVILLLKAGPDTTHTEHWRRGTDTERVKMRGMKLHVPRSVNYGQTVSAVMRLEKTLLFGRDDVIQLTVPSPDISGVTATAQFSWGKNRRSILKCTKGMIQSLPELRIIGEKLYLSCRVSVIQQSELHENRHIFGLWDSFFRFLQQRQLNQRIMFKTFFFFF